MQAAATTSMIALLLFVATIASAEIPSRVSNAMATIADTTTFDGCVENVDDPMFISNTLQMDEISYLVSDAKRRVNRLQGDFAFDVQDSVALKEHRIIFDIDNYRELWNLSTCFDCVLKSSIEEEKICSVFRKKMTNIENAINILVESSDPVREAKELSDFYYSILGYLSANQVKMYHMKNLPVKDYSRRKPVVSTYEEYYTFLHILVANVACFCFVGLMKHIESTNLLGFKKTNPWIRAGKGRFCDGFCCICYDDEENIPWTTLNRCEHSFHSKCLDMLIEESFNTCPFCSRSMLL
jgi:hypothetical protein